MITYSPFLLYVFVMILPLIAYTHVTFLILIKPSSTSEWAVIQLRPKNEESLNLLSTGTMSAGCNQ